MNKPPKKNKTQLKRELQQVINELVNTPCTFWACPGPNKPVENMATCKKCYQIKRLREIRDSL